MTDRDLPTEFDALVRELDAARREAIEQDRIGTPEAIALAKTAVESWCIAKERLKDLLDDWVEIGGLTHREL